MGTPEKAFRNHPKVMESQLFSGTPENKQEIFQEKSFFSRKKSTFPRETLRKSTKVFKIGYSFPVGNSRRNKSGIGIGNPDPKKSGSGFTSRGHNPRIHGFLLNLDGVERLR